MAMKLDQRFEGILQTSVLNGATLHCFAYAENDKGGIKKMFGVNRHFLVAITDQGAKVVQMSGTFASPKKIHDVNPQTIQSAATTPFKWKVNGLNAGQGMLLCTTLRTGESLALRLTNQWAALDSQEASFEPICQYWASLSQA